MLQRSSQLGITVMVLLAVSAVAQTPDLNNIVERMTAAQVAAHGNVRPYEVTRQYLYYQGDIKPQPDSNVIASVTYNPPDSKEYSIQNATGSGRGQHVVRKVLDHETQMAGQWQQSAVTEENYKFSLLGEETLNGRRCFILGLEPRRDAKELLKGRAWVDAHDYRIRQMQGEPSKSPSFWIKKLNITLAFSEVEGMWMQTGVSAAADVRMFGKNVLVERDLDHRVGAAVAVKATPRRSRAETNIATFVR